MHHLVVLPCPLMPAQGEIYMDGENREIIISGGEHIELQICGGASINISTPMWWIE